MLTFSSPYAHQHKQTAMTALIAFAFITFLFNTGDAMMSYMSPNIVEGITNNSFYMGIIISLSSFIGFFCDYFIGNVFKEKSFYTYLFWGILIAAVFPLLFLSSYTLPIIILGMASWGVYYEMILFSKSNFIHHTLPHDKHDTGWGYITGFTSLAYLIGPNVAVALAVNQKLPLIVALAIQLIALIGALVFRFVFKKLIKQPIIPGNHHPTPLQGIKLWGVLNKRLWPVLLFMFCLILLDATFWTVGAILVNEMSATYHFAGLLYVAYLLPTMIFPPIGIYLSRHIGKKRAAFIAGIAGGLVLTLSFLTPNYPAFLILIAISSIFLAAGFPEIHGAIEDYCERLGTHANALVGLTNSMGSLAYVIGPILAGAIALKVGAEETFSVVGLIITLCSLLALIVVPRKIKLPQAELHQTYE